MCRKVSLFNIGLVVVLLSLLVGCASTEKIVANVSDAIKNQNFLNKNINQLNVLDNTTVPADIRLSVAALVLEMRHKKTPVGLVRFSKDGSHFIREKNFNYSGFKWNSMIITRYDVTKRDNRNSDIVLEGALYFSDNVARFTSSTFRMDYRVENNKRITVLNSSLADNFSSHPIVKTYFVPLSALEKKHKEFNNFNSLYAFARKHSVRMQANDKEQDGYNKLTFVQKMRGEVPDKTIKGRFVALVFCLDRFPDYDRLSLDVTDENGKSLIKNSSSLTYFDYSGWKVGMVGLKGKIRSSERPFLIKVYNRGNDKEKQIGLFKSTFYYGDKGDFSRAPLTKKDILLNPDFRENAKLIQARLYALGYYSGAIDGLFGKNSKRALQKFNQEYRKSDTVFWDIKTQKLLFEGSGL